MTSRTHDIIAFATLLTIASYFPPEKLNLTTGILSLVGCTVGSLMPDIDQAANRLWDLLPVGNFVGRILRNLLLAHRTVSHSLLGLFAFYKLLFLVLPKIFNAGFVNPHIVGISILIGFIAHLAADLFTEDGIPLLFPLKFKFGFPPFKILRIKAGGWVEKFLVFPGVLVYIVWFATRNSEKLVGIVKLIAR